MLESSQLCDSVTNIRARLCSSSKGEVRFDLKHSGIVEDIEEALITDTSKQVEDIRLQGLSQYVESEVALLESMGLHLWLVSIASQQCIERKLPFTCLCCSHKNPAEEFLNDLRLLQKAHGVRGIAKLVGVVLSDDRSRLCSYLIQDVSQTPFRTIFELAEKEKRITPYRRREKWIRQIITTVADLHKRGTVIGHIYIGDIWIDASDNAVIIPFTATKTQYLSRKGYTPPELRGPTLQPASTSEQSLTVHSDIFRLGLQVYMLAENIWTVDDQFCDKARCTTRPRIRCAAKHRNPAGLPLCRGDLPAYINTIVSHCRQEQQHLRKPAPELLKLLPCDGCTTVPTADYPTPYLTRAGALQCLFFLKIYCDECGALTTDSHYRCDICFQGDFDLCPQCVAAGVSSLDRSHRLYHKASRDGRFMHKTADVRCYEYGPF